MESKFGLYEIFAYMVPGAFYLLTILYCLSTFGVIAINFTDIT